MSLDYILVALNLPLCSAKCMGALLKIALCAGKNRHRRNADSSGKPSISHILHQSRGPAAEGAKVLQGAEGSRVFASKMAMT